MKNASHLERLAAEVAISAPPTPHVDAVCAYIPWAVINEIRNELELRGFDWRAATKARIKIDHERKVEAAERRKVANEQRNRSTGGAA